MVDQTILYSPLGGSGEIGMNMYAYGFKKGNKAKYILVDTGVAFPKFQSEPGVDLIFANPSIILNNIKDLEGIFITHAHEDHLGAIGFIASKIDCKIYCRKFTASIVKDKLNRINVDCSRIVIVDKWPYFLKLEYASVSFFPVIHSVPEASFLIIKTEIGSILHTGDFKLDATPVIGEPLDLKVLMKALEGNPILCVADSTNLLNHTKGKSERSLKTPIEKIIKQSKGRIIFTSFASNLGRLKTIAIAGQKAGRSVVVLGRAMNNMLSKALETEVLSAFPPTIDPKIANQLPRQNLLIIATGSQGEPRAVSSQLSRGKYMNLELNKGDTFIFSSKTIPGNEVAVNRVINNLTEKGIIVRYEEDRIFHVSGHTNVPDLENFYKSIKPKIVVPMHGEERHLAAHSDFLTRLNIENIIVRNGDVIEIDENLGIKSKRSFLSEKLFLDGNIIASSENAAFSERRKLAAEGVLIIHLRRIKRGNIWHVDFNPIGLPRFDDYGLEIDYKIKKYMEKNYRKTKNSDLDLKENLERLTRKELFSFCGKKPLVKVFLLN